MNPGTILGNLLQDISAEVQVAEIPVVATAGHDTGAAVAAVPAEGADWAYISSGTWSLIGVERPEPIINTESREMNFTNEGGIEGTVRFLKNVTGLWLVRQCRKAWAKDKPLSYDELAVMAEFAAPRRAFIDPDAPDFLNPPDMPQAISDFCLKTGQRAPQTQSEFMRCILESLALKYRHVLERLESLIGRPIGRIHIIGGGSQNRVLCRFTADATGIPVVTGPVEATSVGNILVQALALGYVSGRSEMRQIIRNSFDLGLYGPGEASHWDAAYKVFKSLLAS
jgi:rhamnulokinase